MREAAMSLNKQPLLLSKISQLCIRQPRISLTSVPRRQMLNIHNSVHGVCPRAVKDEI